MNPDTLSEQGLCRRDQILLLAKTEAKRRRRKRVAVRGMSLCAIFTAGGLASLRLRPQAIQPVAHQMIAQVPAMKPLPAPSVAIEYIQTDPTITQRLTLTPQPPRWTTVNDDELLHELAAAGQPTGIAYINGKPILLSRADEDDVLH